MAAKSGDDREQPDLINTTGTNSDDDTELQDYINTSGTISDDDTELHDYINTSGNALTCADETSQTNEDVRASDDCSSDDIERLLTCSACNKRYTDPKLLVCFHSCCAECIQLYKSRGSDMIICQYCRTSQPYPNEGLSGICSSYTLADLISVVNRQGVVKELCEACEKGENPEFVCTTCDVALCDMCRVAHGNLKITKNHEVLPVKSVVMSPLAMISRKRQNVCEKHGEAIVFRCNTCGLFICQKAAIAEHTGHTIDSLEDMRNKSKKAILELERKAKQIVKFSNTIKSSAKSNETKVSEYLETVELKLDQTIGDVIQVLNKQTSILKIQIQNRKEQESDRRSAVLKARSEIERSSKHVHHILQKIASVSSDLDALTLYSSCERIFSEANKEKISIPQDIELFFKPSDLLLQLLTSTACGTLCEIGNYPAFLLNNATKTINSISNVTGIARNKFGEIALTSFWNNKLMLVGPSGATIRDMSSDVLRPWDVAFTNDNCMAVSEGGDNLGQGKLKLFSPAGTFIKSVQECSKSPGGITVDRNGRLLVCDDHEACVKIFSLNGRLVDQIKSQESEYQFQGPLYVTTNINDDIIVCDDHRSIKIFTSTGRKKNTYNVSSKHYLQGVCTDSFGQILVVDSLGKGIHVLTANGVLRRFLVLEELKNFGEMQSICTRSPTSVMIAGKSSEVAIVELFQDQDFADEPHYV